MAVCLKGQRAEGGSTTLNVVPPPDAQPPGAQPQLIKAVAIRLSASLILEAFV